MRVPAYVQPPRHAHECCRGYLNWDYCATGPPRASVGWGRAGVSLVWRCRSVAGQGEPVADRWVALQQFSSFIAELPPYPVRVHLEVVQFLDVAGTPHVLEDHPPGADLAGVAGEVGEEAELSGGEIQGAAAPGCLAVHEVEVQVTDVELGGLPVAWGGLMPERHLDPGVKFPHPEGLGHVVIGALVQGINLSVLRAVRGEHHDGHVAPRPDARAHR